MNFDPYSCLTWDLGKLLKAHPVAAATGCWQKPGLANHMRNQYIC